MQWFKHDSNANTDDKLQEVLLDYGLEGYGLYWYCLELIVNKIDQDNLTFELKHDARIIARNTGSTVQKVEEMMRKFISLGLFEDDGGRVTCLKLRSRLDKSMTSNSYIRKIITNMKVDNEEYGGYLYFILAKNETVKRIKIGRSKNPSSRLNELRRRSDCIGMHLEILHTIKSDDCVSLETEMHRKFKIFNLKDEWFECSDEILNHINTLRPDDDNVRNDYELKEEIRLDDIRTDIKPFAQKIEKVNEDFELFWLNYPKKKSKGTALKAWKVKKPRIDNVLYALSWQRESMDWTKDGGKYIPYPASYLNAEGWNDEEPQNNGVPF